jgi:hypothetical protein
LEKSKISKRNFFKLFSGREGAAAEGAAAEGAAAKGDKIWTSTKSEKIFKFKFHKNI